MTGASITPCDHLPEAPTLRAFMEGFADSFVRFDYDLERFRRLRRRDLAQVVMSRPL